MKKNFIEIIKNLFFLLPFIDFPEYVIGGIYKNIFDAYSLIIMIYIIFKYIRFKSGKFSDFSILVMLMQFVPIVSTIINKNYSLLFNGFYVLLSTFSITLLIELKLKKEGLLFIKSLMIFFGIFVLINTLSFYIFYPSMSPNELYFYFLGNDNGSIFESLIFIIVGLTYFLSKNTKISIIFKIIILFILSGYVYVKSGNGIACLFGILFFLIFNNSKIFRKILNLPLLISGYISIFYLIIINSSNSVAKFILMIFSKDVTYSGRTIIWSRSLKYIRQNLFFGNGYESNIVLKGKIYQIKSHNMLVQLLYNGGIVMIVFLGILLYKCSKKIKQYEKNNKKISCLFKYALLLYFIIGMFDYYYTRMSFFILIGLIYNYQYLTKGDELCM